MSGTEQIGQAPIKRDRFDSSISQTETSAGRAHREDECNQTLLNPNTPNVSGKRIIVPDVVDWIRAPVGVAAAACHRCPSAGVRRQTRRPGNQSRPNLESWLNSVSLSWTPNLRCSS